MLHAHARWLRAVQVRVVGSESAIMDHQFQVKTVSDRSGHVELCPGLCARVTHALGLPALTHIHPTASLTVWQGHSLVIEVHDSVIVATAVQCDDDMAKIVLEEIPFWSDTPNLTRTARFEGCPSWGSDCSRVWPGRAILLMCARVVSQYYHHPSQTGFTLRLSHTGPLALLTDPGVEPACCSSWTVAQ